MKKITLVLTFAFLAIWGCEDDPEISQPKEDETETTTNEEVLSPNVSDYYLPKNLTFISWDFPNVVHTGIDVDYKMTGYDWYNRALSWSVDVGPSDMTIDTDGTIHWTPAKDQSSEEVTIGLTFDGADKITKTFTVTVDNSRCYFVATDGNDETGDGSINKPFATREMVIKTVGSDSDGKTIFIREGNYTLENQHWITKGNVLKEFANKNWNDEDHLLWRNYPGEQVTLTVLSGTTFRQYGRNVSYQGINSVGGTTGEAGAWNLKTRQIAKLCTASGYRCSKDNNPHGFHVAHGAIIDACRAWDNHDSDPTQAGHHNNANFLLFPEGMDQEKPPLSYEEIFVIDCIGEGQSGSNFKTKRVEGKCKVLFHNCISYGEGTRGFVTYNNGQSIRHCWSISASSGPARTCVALSGGSAYPGDTDGGGLVQNCLLVNKNSSYTIYQNYFVFGSLPETPSLLDNNVIVIEQDQKGALFRMSNAHKRESTWTMKWTDNQVFMKSPEHAIDLETMQDFSILNDTYGSGNTLLENKGSYTKIIQGRTFQYDDGVFSEL